MLELRCPSCGRANAVVDPDRLEATRCAECEGALDAGRTVRYRVADAGRTREPQALADLVRAATAGTLTADVLLSEEHGPWFRAGEREDLFPRVRPQVPVRTVPIRRHRAHVVPMPGPVQTMVALELLVGALALLLAFVAFGLLVSSGYLLEGLLPILLLAGFGVGHLRLARGLRARSLVARNVQLLLAGLGGVGLLSLAATAAPRVVLLLCGLFVAIPFLLLVGGEARAWFSGPDEERPD